MRTKLSCFWDCLFKNFDIYLSALFDFLNNGFPEINEKLSKDGETIYIADADGNPMISYDFGSQTDDISYGP